MDSKQNIFKYSLVIRTLGNAGDKYQRLINSALSQTVLPVEIIVVLPEGYDLDYIFGGERIIYTQKGMVNQRIVGIENSNSEYILVVDDDVCFDPNFVESLYQNLLKENADIVLPLEKSIRTNQSLQLGIKAKVVKFQKTLKNFITGQRFFHSKKSPYIYKICTTGGSSENSLIKENQNYLTQTGNFQCFFAKTQFAQKVRFREELWLDLASYTGIDDQIFFYKSFLLGFKIVYIPSVKYIHLDAAAGNPKQKTLDKVSKRLYTNSLQRTIFWYRFLFTQANFPKKIILIISLFYSITGTFLLYLLLYLFKPKFIPAIFSVIFGFVDSFKFINKYQLKSLILLK